MPSSKFKTLLVIIFAGLFFTAFLQSSARAFEPAPPVTAHVKFLLRNGKKSFGAHWFEKSQKGLINFSVIWDKYDDSVKTGFKLDTALSKTFLSPQLTPGCSIESLRGSLHWLPQQVSPVSVTVVGPGCPQFIEATRKKRIEIQFTQVTQLTTGLSTELLIVSLDEPAE